MGSGLTEHGGKKERERELSLLSSGQARTNTCFSLLLISKALKKATTNYTPRESITGQNQVKCKKKKKKKTAQTSLEKRAVRAERRQTDREPSRQTKQTDRQISRRRAGDPPLQPATSRPTLRP